MLLAGDPWEWTEYRANSLPAHARPLSPAVPTTAHRYPAPNLPNEGQRINIKAVARAKTIIAEVKAGKLPNVIVVALPTATTTISAVLAAAGIANPGDARGVIAIPTHAFHWRDAREVEALLPVA